MWSFNTHSSADNAEKFSYSNLNNYAFLGASVGVDKKFILGQNVIVSSQSHKTGSEDASTISLMEIGPRFMYYFDENRLFAFSAAWHPYVSGSRKMANPESSDIEAGASEKVSGSSYLVAIHFHMKISKAFGLGFSLNYHGVSISESKVDETNTTVSHTYSSYYPAVDLAFRF